MTGSVALSPNHGPCATHLAHFLTCAAHEALLTRSEGQCELCGIEAHLVLRGRLCIEHDNRHGPRATRGLVCLRCNQHLRYVDSGHRRPDERTLAYLALSNLGPPPPRKVNLTKWDGRFGFRPPADTRQEAPR